MSTTIPTHHPIEGARWKARNRVANILVLTSALAVVLAALTQGPSLMTWWFSTFTTVALLLAAAGWVATKTAQKYEFSLTELAEQFAADLRKPKR